MPLPLNLYDVNQPLFTCSNSPQQLQINFYSNFFRENKQIQSKQENALRCSNLDDLLQLSFTLNISIFSAAYI